MSTMLIAGNLTRESGSFMGDQCCALKTAYLFVANQPGVDRVLMSMSPGNEMHFVWERFLADPRGDGSVPPVEVVMDDWNPGDWPARWTAWDRWRAERNIDGVPFDHYRELYLRVHGGMRQTQICGHERGLGRRNIFEYWLAGQEDKPDEFPGADVYDVEIDHPPHNPTRDVYVSPLAKTQGNNVFTFDWWSEVVRHLVDQDISVTVGYDGWFCDDLQGHPNFHKHWGDHRQWMEQICQHKLICCGNTGTGWLAAACGVPLLTMEPHGSVMADHRYRECGLRNLVEVVDGTKIDDFGGDMRRVADYVVRRIIDTVRRRLVLTTGCYDILHAGHVRHLERARALGTKLIVALNSDASVRELKGAQRPINPENQRRTVLEALRCVDEVRVFDGPDALPLIRELRPDVLACGYGYTPATVVGADYVESYGGAVAITCAADATTDEQQPSTTKILHASRKSEIWSIVRAASVYSVNPPDKLRLVAEQLLSVDGVAGDAADLGAFRGGCAYLMRRLASERRLHVFDTWRGNPYDDPLCHHKMGEWQARLSDCRTLVGNDAETFYWEGVFPESVTDFGVLPIGDAIRRSFAFVYVDMDTYRATRDAIEFFWPRLVPGGKILFDDYGWGPCAGVQKAVDEVFRLAPGRGVLIAFPPRHNQGDDYRANVVGYTYIVEKV